MIEFKGRAYDSYDYLNKSRSFLIAKVLVAVVVVVVLAALLLTSSGTVKSGILKSGMRGLIWRSRSRQRRMRSLKS